MVGNVGVNRARGDCLDFRNVRTLQQKVYMKPGGFEATVKGYFYRFTGYLENALTNGTTNGTPEGSKSIARLCK